MQPLGCLDQAVQTVLEVGDDVLHVLQTHGQTYQSFGYVAGSTLFGCVGRVGHAGRMLDEGFRIAQACLLYTSDAADEL